MEARNWNENQYWRCVENNILMREEIISKDEKIYLQRIEETEISEKEIEQQIKNIQDSADMRIARLTAQIEKIKEKYKRKV